MWIIFSGALHNFNMYALNGFVPALIKRYHNLSDRNAGLVAGVILGAVGVVGLLCGGWVADRVQRARPNGRLLVAAIAMLLSAPCIYIGVTRPPGNVASFMGWGRNRRHVDVRLLCRRVRGHSGRRGTRPARDGNGAFFFVMYILGGAFGSYVLAHSVTGSLSER